MNLLNPCKYSFKDLVFATNLSYTEYESEAESMKSIDKYLKILYSLSQVEKNNEIKKLCKESGWYFKDVIGDDGIIYTSFSPFIKL